MKKRVVTKKASKKPAPKVELTEQQRAEKQIWDNLMLPALRKGFRFRRAAEFDILRSQFSSKKGEHIGRSFVRRVAQRPQTERKLVADARKRYETAKRTAKRMEKAVDNPRVPIQEMAQMLADYMYQSHSASLDYIFDAETYVNTIKRNLKPGQAKRLNNEIINSLMPSNGIDNVLSFRRHGLLFLAHELGKKSSHPSVDSFRDYNIDWYRRNYITLGKRTALFHATEKTQKQEIEKVVRKPYGIKTFEDALNALKELHRETMIRKLKLKRIVDNLARNAKPGKEQVIRALAHFAAESIALDETVHLTNSSVAYNLVVGAEKRNIPMEQAVGMFMQIISKKRK